MIQIFFKYFLLAFLVQLAGCASVGKSISNPWSAASVGGASGASGASGAMWQHFRFPGKQSTQFTYGYQQGRHAVEAVAQSSASMWRQVLRIEPAQLNVVKFSWKVPGLIAGADMAKRDHDDSPARVVLSFDGDRSKFSVRNVMLSEMARLLTGEEMPYATLMYVWCNACERESMIVNPRTDRVRKLALESGPERLNHWIDYERDIRADFEKTFGEPPGALISVALMTDTDNTKSDTKVWYGPISLTPLPP